MQLLPGSDQFNAITLFLVQRGNYNFYELSDRFALGTFELIHFKNTLLSLGILNQEGNLIKSNREIDSIIARFSDKAEGGISPFIFVEMETIINDFRAFFNYFSQNSSTISFSDKSEMIDDFLTFDIFYLTMYNDSSRFNKTQKALGYHLLRLLSLTPEIYFPINSAEKLNRLATLPTFERKFDELAHFNIAKVKTQSQLIKNTLVVSNKFDLLFGRLLLMCPEHIYQKYFAVLLKYSKFIFLLDKVISPREYDFIQDLKNPELQILHS